MIGEIWDEGHLDGCNFDGRADDPPVPLLVGLATERPNGLWQG